MPIVKADRAKKDHSEWDGLLKVLAATSFVANECSKENLKDAKYLASIAGLSAACKEFFDRGGANVAKLAASFKEIDDTL